MERDREGRRGREKEGRNGEGQRGKGKRGGREERGWSSSEILPHWHIYTFRCVRLCMQVCVVHAHVVCVFVCVRVWTTSCHTHHQPTSHSCSYRCQQEASLALAELCIPTGLQLPQPVQLESVQQPCDAGQDHVGHGEDS